MAGNESPTAETANRFYNDEANEPVCVGEKFAVPADGCSCVDPFLTDRPNLEPNLHTTHIQHRDAGSPGPMHSMARICLITPHAYVGLVAIHTRDT